LRAFVVGLPLGALAVNILIIDDMRDRHFDAEKGWLTGPVRFGIRWSRLEYAAMVALAYLIPFWLWLCWGLALWVLLPLVTFPVAWAIARRVWAEDRLLPLTPMAALLCLGYSILLAIGIAI